jgi:hypothetical protein
MIVPGSSFRCGFAIESLAYAIEEWYRELPFTDQRMDD